MANGERKTSASASKASQTRKAINRSTGHVDRILRLLSALESRIDAGDEFKVTVADYIRLLQLQREYEQDAPKYIEVKWVDSLTENDATET